LPPENEKNSNTLSRAAGVARVDKAGQAMALFAGFWGAKYGAEYAPSESDWGVLRKFISRTAPHLLADLPKAFERYLADESPFVMQQMRHGLKFFITSNGFSKYRTPEVLVTTQREVDNRRAGAQWLALSDQGNGHGRR
jgi:hypothetical protein